MSVLQIKSDSPFRIRPDQDAPHQSKPELSISNQFKPIKTITYKYIIGYRQEIWMQMSDKIKELVLLMEELAGRQQYENAQHVLSSIKNELQKTKPSPTFEQLVSIEKKEFGIKDTYDIITGNTIRLNPDAYKFSDFLNLLMQSTEKLKKLKNPYTVSNDYNVRKIIAEEMVCKKMTVPVTYKGIKPNRAFLDVAFKVNPDLCKHEIERREKVKLWKAIESGKKEEIEKAKKEVSKYHKKKSSR